MAIGDVALAARLLPYAIKNAMDEASLRPEVLAVLDRMEDPELRAWEEATRPDDDPPASLPAPPPHDEASAPPSTPARVTPPVELPKTTLERYAELRQSWRRERRPRAAPRGPRAVARSRAGSGDRHPRHPPRRPREDGQCAFRSRQRDG
jgi:hypothetical protein